MVTIKIDFEICPRLIDLYLESTEDEFIGDKNKTHDLESAREKLQVIADTGMFADFARYGIMKIYKDGLLVGFSLPRKILTREYKYFGISETDDRDWSRIGTVFLDKTYRSMGIMGEVVDLFTKMYPNLVWECNAKNIASAKCASRIGFQHIGTRWLISYGVWSDVYTPDAYVAKNVFNRPYVDNVCLAAVG